MNRALKIPLICLSALLAITAPAEEAAIHIYADQIIHRISRHLTGACIEDVNHEVYGGIDSQMIFGESFGEPAPQPPLKDFAPYGGRWIPTPEGSLQAGGADGPKLLCDVPAFSEGEASVDLRFSEAGGGNAGLIVKTSQLGNGADQFNGYEISLEPSGVLVLGRHRLNWEPLRRIPCEVRLNEWITLTVRMKATSLEVMVNGRPIIAHEDAEHPLESGGVGLRTWQHQAEYRNFSVAIGGARRNYEFVLAAKDGWASGVSGMWSPVQRGSASGRFSLNERNPYSGRQSQRIDFVTGDGEIGIENRGLNRWGMNFVANKTYEGFVCVRADKPTELWVALESRNGERVYAAKRLQALACGWQRLTFKLKPKEADRDGCFGIKLRRPGAIEVGYAFLQPGPWGRFKGLPVRQDVAQGLIDQGITVLRQGGCMANAAEYRWKKMIGPREQRPPYAGWWYPHSSNGWGILDFLNFCEAAGFLAIPDVNIGETPEDMADFIEYVNGPVTSPWGRRRATDGHPKPYQLTRLQIGNEERLDENYWQRFKPIAEAIWAKDANIILVVGDFAYGQPISDPFNFKGAAAPITSLAAQQKILHLAKAHNREVWFDVHVNTDGPLPDFGGTFSYIDALKRIADGAKHRVVIFEFNAGNHSQKRALANAAAINWIERDGRLPIATSANCLQPDRQNDNDWDQGLLFLNPEKVWLQPPGYVTRMISRNYQPLLVKSEVSPVAAGLDVTAKRDESGKTLVVQVVNAGEKPQSAKLNLTGFVPRKGRTRIETLSGPLESRNTAENPHQIKPQVTERESNHGNTLIVDLPPHSFTVIRLD